MKREIIIIAALLLCLPGCARDTMVYIPDEAAGVGEGIVVYIPVDPDKPTEAGTQPAEVFVSTEPEETEPEQKNSATISKQTGSSSNKGTSSNKGNSSNMETITGSSQKPAETQPPAQKPSDEKNQTTVTKPPVTEPAATEPPATEPPATEPPATEPPATEPPATEPPATEPPETEPPLYDISGYVVGDLEYSILAQINEYRAEEELGELYMDEYLCAIASCRSYEASQFWSHTRPDGRGYETVLLDYGYGGSAAGELLAYSTGDAAVIVDKWMSSESHRAILMGSSSLAGIGIYYDSGVIYVTCLLVG